MKYREQDIIQFFHLTPFGQKGWLIADKCPYCGAKDKFGVKFDSYYKGKKVSSFNCFAGSCKKHGSVYQLLKDFNRLDLVDIKFVNIYKELEEKRIIFEEEENVDYSMIECEVPLGYKRIYNHSYLKERGFDNQFFQIHNIGVTSLDPHVGKDYIVFLLEDQDKCVGWLKRSIYSKEYIKRLKDQGKSVLRWGNSKGTDFEKYIYGINEFIKDVTKTAILVEGITSKQNVDKLLDLYNRDEIKCGATFGKKISKFQIKRLLDKGVKDIILLYDPDAVEQSKQYSLELNKYFNVLVGYIKNPDEDPGDLTLEELEYVLTNLESPLSFRMNKLQKRSLIPIVK